MTARRWQLIRALQHCERFDYVHWSSILGAMVETDDGTARVDRILTEATAFVKDRATFEFWAVVERPGWYTSTPSEEVRRTSYYHYHLKPHMTEYARMFGMLKRHRKGTWLEGSAGMWSQQHDSYARAFAENLPEPDRADDHCLLHIDRLVAEGLTEG